MKNLLLIVFCFLCLSGCDPTDEELIQAGGELVNMRVNSYTVDCVGEMQGTCLLVQEDDAIGSDQWNYFYFSASIEGFEYETGFVYDLLVKKTLLEDAPQDASSSKYELVKIISKKEN